MKEKSILEMVGGEKHINPHYNIKREELKDEMKNRISLALKDPILQQGFEIICKENAELKEDNSEWEKASDKWKNLYYSTNNQLTKAKEIIRKLIDYPRIYGQASGRYKHECDLAEQFLNSEVEK